MTNGPYDTPHGLKLISFLARFSDARNFTPGERARLSLAPVL